MSDLELREASLSAAADRLVFAASSLRDPRALPMLGAPSYTGIGELVSGFMRSVDLSLEALGDAAMSLSRATSELLRETGEADAALSAGIMGR